MWCTKYAPWWLETRVTNPDVRHCPNPVRAHGTLQNLQDFANDFKCPPESLMNPSKKCPRIW